MQESAASHLMLTESELRLCCAPGGDESSALSELAALAWSVCADTQHPTRSMLGVVSPDTHLSKKRSCSVLGVVKRDISCSVLGVVNQALGRFIFPVQ